jgi:hypothetical protein
MVYRFATGGAIDASLSGYGTRTLLAASEDMTVYAIDLFTADALWTFSTGAPVMQQPLVAGQDVLVVNTAGVLSNVDAKTGSPRWSTRTHHGRLLAVSKGRVYLESINKDLFIIDRGTGKMLADPGATHERAGLNLRDYNLGPTNIYNDRMVLGTKSGLIISLREIGQTQPFPLKDPKEKPFGFIPAEGLSTTPVPSAEPKKEEGEATEENAKPAEEKPAAEGEKEAPKEDEKPE